MPTRPTLPLSNRKYGRPLLSAEAYTLGLLDTSGVFKVFGNKRYSWGSYEQLVLNEIVDFAVEQKSSPSGSSYLTELQNQRGYVAIKNNGTAYWIPPSIENSGGAFAPWQAVEIKRRTNGAEVSLNAVKVQHETNYTWRILLADGETILITISNGFYESLEYLPTNWTATTEPSEWQPKTVEVAADFRFPTNSYLNRFPLPCDWQSTEIIAWVPSALKIGQPFSSTLTNVNESCFPNLGNFTATGLPSGLSISSTGAISGTPTQSGNYSTRFFASSGAVSVQSPLYSTTVFNAAPDVSNLTINVELGESFSSLLTVNNLADSGPVSWRYDVASYRPEWTSLVGDIFSGTPTASGSFSVRLTASNSSGSTSFLVTVVVAPLPPVILPDQKLGGRVGQFRSTLSLQPGTGPASSWAASGLPSFLTLSPTTGIISGSPTEDFSATILVTATNSRGSDTKPASVFTYQLPVVSLAELTFQAESQISHQFTVENPVEAGVLEWAADDLPEGLSLSVAGELTGAASFLGETTFTIYAVGTAGSSLPRTVKLTFTPAAPRFATSPEKKLWSGIPALFEVAPENSALCGPLTWAAASLPPWLTLQPSGTITGTPVSLAPFDFEITATGVGGTASTTVSVTVQAPPRKYLLKSATSPTSSHWIRKAGRTVSTFDSGLCLIQEEYVCPAFLADLSFFQVGDPISNSDPCIDGAFIFPAPSVVEDENGFTTARVSSYGRWRTAPHVTAYKTKLPMSLSVSIREGDRLYYSETPTGEASFYFFSDVIVKKFVLPTGSDIDLVPPSSELRNYSATGRRLPSKLDILAVQELFGGALTFSRTYDNVISTQKIKITQADHTSVNGDDFLPHKPNISLSLVSCEEINFGKFTEYTVTFEPKPPVGIAASLIGRSLSFKQ